MMKVSMKLVILSVIGLVLIGSALVVYSMSGSSHDTGKPDVGMDSAKNSVKSFTGSQSIALKDSGMKSFPSFDVYEMNTSDCVFYVNSRTGEVWHMFNETSALNSGKVSLSINEAEKVARKYLSQKYADFGVKNMRLVDSELVDHGSAGKEYVFSWNEQVDGVYTLNIAQVSVNPATGDVISYTGSHEAVTASLKPAVSKEKAIGIAKAQWKGIDVRKVDAELHLFDEGNVQKLAWGVSLHGNWSDGYEAYETVIVNAANGDVVLLG